MTRALAIVGPTACGKTAAALALAQAWPGGAEVISMDSALIYQGMDIGTAKPSAAELAQVPHHLIDILAPHQAYSAADFARDARALIAQIQARGKLPLVVGGTMLYLKALREGLSDLPASPPEVRQAVAAQAAQQGWPAMHALLQAVDPETAARLAPGDSQRIGRALEVYRASGHPLSWWHQRAKPAGAALDMPIISLEPDDRAWLHARIAERFDQMLAQGLVAEVQALRARGDLDPQMSAMRCVGYRQTWQALDEGWDMATLRQRGIEATRQLAKRQITWLRSLPERHRVAADGDQPVAAVLALAQRLLGTPG